MFLLPASGFFCQPAAVGDVLPTARYLRTANRIELYIDVERPATIGGLPPVTIAESGLDSSPSSSAPRTSPLQGTHSSSGVG